MNDRPRDRYGRPLRGSFDTAVPGVPDRAEISSDEAWSQALDYLQHDLPFHAHEIFEQRWRCCALPEREIWQALAQWAAALTQLARGNSNGAKANARKSLAKLNYAAVIPTIVNVEEVRTSLEALLR